MCSHQADMLAKAYQIYAYEPEYEITSFSGDWNTAQFKYSFWHVRFVSGIELEVTDKQFTSLKERHHRACFDCELECQPDS